MVTIILRSQKKILELVQPSCIYFKFTSKYLIICTDDAPNYKLVINYLLHSELITFHIYQAKTEKLYNIYIRYLHSTASTQDIQSSLINEGREVIQVTNIINRFIKVNLPLFWSDITTADNNADILKLYSILHTKIELLKKKSIPPQCQNCQAYFHTANYYQRNPRWVKYGEGDSREFEKSSSEPAKCALCSGPHTSSYKGWPS